ncbi:MAG TPA: RNA polymerase factor sigma-54, partial [Rhizobacter sp.]
MKQGLSLRVSQHLALTPQLQQSIRLLQLSTLELSQEVEQMLDENPFLERSADEAAREEFGLESEDATGARDVRDEEAAGLALMNGADGVSTIATQDAEVTAAEAPVESADAEPDWEGDGSVDFSPDDSEWGGDAPARTNNIDDDERADATELARSQESLQDFLHRQALGLRLSDVDRAALRFLIESLNEDGYLEDSLPALASGLAGDDNDEFDELVHRFQMALGLRLSDVDRAALRFLIESLNE